MLPQNAPFDEDEIMSGCALRKELFASLVFCGILYQLVVEGIVYDSVID